MNERKVNYCSSLLVQSNVKRRWFHGCLALRFGFLYMREATFTAHRDEYDDRFDVHQNFHVAAVLARRPLCLEMAVRLLGAASVGTSVGAGASESSS